MSSQKFICNFCQRPYLSKQSLSNHTSIKHRAEKLTKSSHLTINSQPPLTSENTPENTTNKIYTCNFCPKTYKQKQGKSRHMKTCDKKNLINNMQNKINELETKLANINNIPHSIHNEHNNNGTIVNGQLNNGPVNNNYIIKFGAEDLSAILSKEDMIKICNKKFTAIEESIKMTHFNKNKPELNNVIIKNLRDEYAYIHDGESYIVQEKNDIIADLIELHLDNIEMIINEENENNIRNKLDKKVIDKLEKIRDRLDDETEIKINEKRYENYKSYKINQIKLLIYNCINKLKIIMNK